MQISLRPKQELKKQNPSTPPFHPLCPSTDDINDVADKYHKSIKVSVGDWVGGNPSKYAAYKLITKKPQQQQQQINSTKSTILTATTTISLTKSRSRDSKTKVGNFIRLRWVIITRGRCVSVWQSVCVCVVGVSVCLFVCVTELGPRQKVCLSWSSLSLCKSRNLFRSVRTAHKTEANRINRNI